MTPKSQIEAFEFRSGKLRPYVIETHSFDEALREAGRGTYTVFRVYAGNRVLRFQDHIDRLRRSAAILEMPFLHNSAMMREAVKCAIKSTDICLPRICLFIPIAAPDTIVVMLQEFSPPTEEEYQQGVRVAVASFQRRKPSAKDSSFILERSGLRRQHPEAREILMCDEGGQILEGLSSNFFAVMNDELYTAQDKILEGISRAILLEVAREILPVNLEPIHISDCSQISEAFLTSSSRGVLPVTEIGKTRIGSGKPGPVTSNLRTLFDARVDAELEPLFQFESVG